MKFCTHGPHRLIRSTSSSNHIALASLSCPTLSSVLRRASTILALTWSLWYCAAVWHKAALRDGT